MIKFHWRWLCFLYGGIQLEGIPPQRKLYWQERTYILNEINPEHIANYNIRLYTYIGSILLPATVDDNG